MLSSPKKCTVGVVEVIDNRSWFRNASKFEKFFWATILFFLIIFIFLHFFASREFYKSKSEHTKSQTIFKEIEVVVNSNIMRHNLEDNKTIKLILDDLNSHIKDVNNSITKETQKLFLEAYNNIDNFLDFHYSVVGEYVELGNMAVGEIEKHIQTRLFGDNFDMKMDELLYNISKSYQYNLKEHLKVIHNKAKVGVDSSLNAKAIEYLKDNIHQNFLLQQGKLGTLLVATVATKLTKTIVTKLATKEASLLASKATAKAGLKSASMATGLSASLMCGPLVWICAPITATTLWFGTDAVIVSIDENLNRDEFKQQIILALKEQEGILEKRLKKHYSSAMVEFSNRARDRYKTAPIKEIKYKKCE